MYKEYQASLVSSWSAYCERPAFRRLLRHGRAQGPRTASLEGTERRHRIGSRGRSAKRVGFGGGRVLGGVGWWAIDCYLRYVFCMKTSASVPGRGIQLMARK